MISISRGREHRLFNGRRPVARQRCLSLLSSLFALALSIFQAPQSWQDKSTEKLEISIGANRSIPTKTNRFIRQFWPCIWIKVLRYLPWFVNSCLTFWQALLIVTVNVKYTSYQKNRDTFDFFLLRQLNTRSFIYIYKTRITH